MIQDVQELLRVTLANSAGFQAFVDADDATEALDKIYHDALPAPASGSDRYTAAELLALRPCAVVYTPNESGWQAVRDAMGDDCWHVSGSLICHLYRNVPSDDKFDYAKVDKDFRVIVGGIVEDLIEMAEVAGRLAMQRIAVEGPFRTDPKDYATLGDAQVYELSIDWGPAV